MALCYRRCKNCRLVESELSLLQYREIVALFYPDANTDELRQKRLRSVKRGYGTAYCEYRKDCRAGKSENP